MSAIWDPDKGEKVIGIFHLVAQANPSTIEPVPLLLGVSMKQVSKLSL